MPRPRVGQTGEHLWGGSQEARNGVRNGTAGAGLLMGALAASPSAAADQEPCRPDGLHETPGVAVACFAARFSRPG
ncbi:hypothetical protein ABZ826_35850 [Streptomyces sp. NPDC047515]|uniref:hypothetical protein n=1 Tax=Streptomyces sp. NPDC047515 TaxID=3155380 RepID=UPI0033EA2D7E